MKEPRPYFLTLAFLPSFLVTDLVCTTALAEQAEGDRTDRIKRSWAQLVQKMDPANRSVEYQNKYTCVVRGLIERSVPEMDPLKISKTYVMVKVQRVLKPFDSTQIDPARWAPEDAAAHSEWKEQKPDWNNPKRGDLICVRLPFSLDPRHIDEKHLSVVIPMTAAGNRFLDLAQFAKVSYEAENPGKQPTAEYLEKKTRELIAYHGLQNIPAQASWMKLIDELLLVREVPWRDFFERLDLEAELLGLLDEENKDLINMLKSEKIKVEKSVEFLRGLVASRHNLFVRQAVANKFFSAGDPYGFKIYAGIFRAVLEYPAKNDWKLPDPVLANKELEWHNSRLVDGYGGCLPILLINLKDWGEIPPLSKKPVELQELIEWLERDHTEDLVFSPENRRFIAKDHKEKHK